jgi:NADH-quinone oxidoreductase subunit M
LPLHGWSSALVRESAPGAAALAIASLGALGAVLLSRVALVLLPAESAWGAPTLLALALASAILLGLAALGERDPKRLAGRLTALSGGLVVVAIASRTAQGLQAAVLLITARTIAVPLVVLTAEAFTRRLGTLDGREGGVAATAPKLAALWVLALLAASGLPGGASFWGVWLGLSGTVARTPTAAIVAVFAVMIVAMAHLAGFGRASRRADPAWRTSERLAAHAGKVPDLFPRELVWAVPLGLALLALGVLPRSVGTTTDTLVIDALPAIDPPGPTQIG